MFPVFHPISVLLCRRQYSRTWFIVSASHTSIVLWRRWVALLFQTIHGLWLPSSYRGNSCSSCYTQGTSTLWHPPLSWWRHSDYADTVHTCNKLESVSCSNFKLGSPSLPGLPAISSLQFVLTVTHGDREWGRPGLKEHMNDFISLWQEHKEWVGEECVTSIF